MSTVKECEGPSYGEQSSRASKECRTMVITDTLDLVGRQSKDGGKCWDTTAAQD